MGYTIRTATVKFVIIAECEACAHPYHWKVTASHQTVSGQDPREGLALQLARDGIPIFKKCPKCGYIQSQMVATWKKKERGNMLFAFLLPMVFAIVLFLMALNAGDSTSRIVYWIATAFTGAVIYPTYLSTVKHLVSELHENVPRITR